MVSTHHYSEWRPKQVAHPTIAGNRSLWEISISRNRCPKEHHARLTASVGGRPLAAKMKIWFLFCFFFFFLVEKAEGMKSRTATMINWGDRFKKVFFSLSGSAAKLSIINAAMTLDSCHELHCRNFNFGMWNSDRVIFHETCLLLLLVCICCFVWSERSVQYDYLRRRCHLSVSAMPACGFAWTGLRWRWRFGLYFSGVVLTMAPRGAIKWKIWFKNLIINMSTLDFGCARSLLECYKRTRESCGNGVFQSLEPFWRAAWRPDFCVAPYQRPNILRI